MNEIERARVEEEFQIVYRLGLRKEPMDLKSAMMNVDDLVKVAHERGREEGLEEALNITQKLDVFETSADWENADEIAMEVKNSLIKAIRKAMEAK